MNKEKIIDYVLNTPNNTNPRILGQMLDEYAAEGGGSTNAPLIVKANVRTLDKTWQEIHDAMTLGGGAVFLEETLTYTEIKLIVSVYAESNYYSVSVGTTDNEYKATTPDGYPEKDLS